MTFKEILYQNSLKEDLPFRTILKEAIQIMFLEELYKLHESDNIVFQGGTCLRLIYGAPRYSDDLDFVTVLKTKSLKKLYLKVSKLIEKLGPLFSGEITSRIQKESERLTRWKLYYTSREDEPRSSAKGEGENILSVNIEFANYPFYTHDFLPLKLPGSYPVSSFILVKAEKKEEIFADKLSAIAGRKYLKGRDIFDLWFLKVNGVKIDRELFLKKLNDYSIPEKNFLEKINSITVVNIKNDLLNFLPKVYRDKFEKENYFSVIESAREIAKQVCI